MKKRTTLLLSLLFVLSNLLSAQEEQKTRSAKWALKIEEKGLPNFHKLNENLYRGAQPDEEGMKKLDSMGVKTIINLRSFHSDRDEMKDLPFNYKHIYVKAWHPEEKEIMEFLQIVTDKKNQPVFVHCLHGADRTGLMCAVYRVAIDGWTKSEALDEMKNGGFGYHNIWKNIENFFLELDIEKIKKNAGL